MKCNNCQKEIEDSSTFCMHCGKQTEPFSYDTTNLSFQDRMHRAASLTPIIHRKHLFTAKNIKIGWSVWWPIFLFNILFNISFKALFSGAHKGTETLVLVLAYIIFFGFLNQIVKSTVAKYYKIELKGFIAWPVILSAICVIFPTALFRAILLPPEPSIPATSLVGVFLIVLWFLLLFASCGWAIQKYLIERQKIEPNAIEEAKGVPDKRTSP